MSGTLYLAWRYVVFHRVKVLILLASITLILYLPLGLKVLVEQSSKQLRARAEATPLLVGSKGSPLELVLNGLYFGSDQPEPTRYAEATRVGDSELATAIPLYTRFRSRDHPIVGTTLDYFEFRALSVAEGAMLTTLGDCVVGHSAARALGVGPGDAVVSSPENVFDLAGVYPLKMSVVGVLSYSDSADDDAIFVDLKTAWVIAGLGHGHQDLAKREAAGAVLSREGNRITANASVVQYNEITADNIDSFHFHGDLEAHPISAVIAVPGGAKESALLQGRYQGDGEMTQIVRPAEVMESLLATVVTVQGFVIAGAAVVGLATLAVAALVFALSLRLRARERQTLSRIGGSRFAVTTMMAAEVAVVLVAAIVLTGGLTTATSLFGSTLIRALVRM